MDYPLFDLPDEPEPETAPHFDGPAYDPAFDHARLTGQIARIYELMRDGAWRTLGEIEAATGDPQASISAQLRHLRKPRFGAHVVERQHRGDRSLGLYEYRLLERDAPREGPKAGLTGTSSHASSGQSER